MTVSRRRWMSLSLAVLLPAAAALAGDPPAPAAKPAVPAATTGAAAPAGAAYDRMKALVGDWIDVDGTFGLKDQVAVTYRLTGAGTTVVETLFAGQQHEMITMYSRDGNDLVLTHYCSGGNQPRMRAKTMEGDIVRFAFDGGTNLDPAKDSHMHAAWFEFMSPDEIRGEWIGWNEGKPSDHVVKFHLRRRQA